MKFNLFKGVLKKERLFFESESKIDYLFVGLGNPGEKYKNTRHNAGLICLEAFLQSFDLNLLPSKGDYYAQIVKIKNNNVLCVFPTTFMNSSGEAVKQVVDKYNIPIENIIVIVDEYNFPVGKTHLKKGGSDGGHNGISSIIYSLNSDEFYRLRFGIDRNFGQGELVQYVLSHFEESEKEKLEEGIDKTVKSLKHIIEIGAQKAMSDINSERLFK